MKTLREMMDLIESAQPVDLRARAAELAIQILKNAHMDDDSEQGYIRVDPNALFQFHVLMNTAKKQGVAEGKKDDSDMEIHQKNAARFGRNLGLSDRSSKKSNKETDMDQHRKNAERFGKTQKNKELEETEADPVRRIEELFRDRH